MNDLQYSSNIILENEQLDIDTLSTDSNSSIILPNKLSIKNKILLRSLDDFYSDLNNFNILSEYIIKKKISLRIIDWFVTNYSKKYNSVINNNFIIFLEYKSQLKAYTKKIFDPFCRRDRIIRYYHNTKINTTLGQLNFFKWAIKNNLLCHIVKNISLIEKDMTVKNDTHSQIKLNKNHIQVRISFD